MDYSSITLGLGIKKAAICDFFKLLKERTAASSRELQDFRATPPLLQFILEKVKGDPINLFPRGMG
jgi:hypothetical protein